MAYPQVASYTSGNMTTEATSTTITVPTGTQSGDLMVLLISKDGASAFTTPTDWTALVNSAGIGHCAAIFYRKLTGGLSGFSISHGSEQTAWILLRIPNGDTPQISSAVTGTSTSANPPSLTHSFSSGREIMWVAHVGNDVNNSISSYPSGFSDNQISSRANTTNGCGVGMATLESATNPTDPGTFTLGSSGFQWTTHTVAIQEVLTEITGAGAIASAEAFGSHNIARTEFIAPTGIASAEAFGTFAISNLGYRGIYPDGIASAEAFGSVELVAGAGFAAVLIGGTRYDFRNGTLRIEDNVSDRSTAEFSIIDIGGLWTFERGEPVQILDRFANVAFAGVIDSVLRYRIHEGTFEHYIVCADNHYFADKRIAAQTYLSMTAGDIVRDLILDYLAAEGITVGVIEEGPTVIETVFNYIPVSEALDQLATIAGFWWAIDVDKKLYFVNPDYHSLSFGMTGYEMQRGTVSVINKNPKYRNRQYVKGGKAITDLQTEIQFGDGSKQAFAVRYPIAQAPTVEVSYNGGAWTAQTRGIKGLDTGFDWYWSKGDLVLAQEISDTPLAAVDRVRVQYYGQWPIVTISERTDEVTRMQTLQGGSGRVEDVVQDAQIDTREAAFQLANSNLQKYSQNSVRVQFDTLQYGLEVGRLVNIVLPDYGIDDNFLIEKLEIWQDAHLVWYRAHCLEGPSEGTWQRFFAEIARRGRPQIDQENIGEDEVLITLVSFSEAIGWAESTTVTPIACPICGVATLAGAGTIVC